eukprot:ctg_15.g50
MSDEANQTVTEYSFQVRWGRQSYEVKLCNATLGSLKRYLSELTTVQPERQKILGLTPRLSLLSDDALLCKLCSKQETKLVLVGTPEAQLRQIWGHEAEVVPPTDDLEGPLFSSSEEIELLDRSKCLQMLNRKLRLVQIPLLNELRPQKLLVLDLDHTLMDCKSGSLSPTSVRPGLHDFLMAVYPYYELCIWSQTSWRWLEAKITEMGLLFNCQYHISFVLDRRCMFAVDFRRKGKLHRNAVKPLDFIWKKFPGHFNRSNTIHVDDLSKNFLLNTDNGLKIAPYTSDHNVDGELYLLTNYLILIAEREVDFSQLKHRKWKRYERRHRGRLRNNAT